MPLLRLARLGTYRSVPLLILAGACSLTLPETNKLGSGPGDAGEPESCEVCPGPKPGAPNYRCPDGSFGGPACERGGDGQCGWIVRTCEPLDAGHPPSGRCGGFTGTACGPGEYCDFPPETRCGAGDAAGTCAPIHQGCSNIIDPVCGCDGKTYSSPCDAARAATSVAHSGGCSAGDGDSGGGDGDAGDDGGVSGGACGGINGQTCPGGQYCAFEAGVCGVGVATGICTPLGTFCDPPSAQPVCGCDGVTYSSACAAAQKGVNIQRAGTCELQQCTPCPEGPEPIITLCLDGVHMSGEFCVTLADGSCGWQYVPCPPTCGPGAPHAAGECWTDEDCMGGSCLGAQCCPPNGDCPTVDHPGTCVSPGEPPSGDGVSSQSSPARKGERPAWR